MDYKIVFFDVDGTITHHAADFVTKKSSEDEIEFALKKYGII